ncbi:hypothetical protein BC939DRAFT_529028 [Gamsiella multidivaricata]|uniref:uncharacterized protein n=1 Tax=Gamsiella multidivaricata TaxID=101098 RepID=UPI002221275F|nr:uncharacterized protein BC939DRAFT_529028 [Gamsiella multidivaricata]KAI7823354.1 hypothetical protein BC939DRAFT_529028 [Gamsiella multidivaricata]
MLAVFLYAIASMLLSIMIINASEPVMDFSHLPKPTATVSSFPPAPAPAVALSLSSSSPAETVVSTESLPIWQDGYTTLYSADVSAAGSTPKNFLGLNIKKHTSPLSTFTISKSVVFWPWRRSGAGRSRKEMGMGTRRSVTTASSSSSRPGQGWFLRQGKPQRSMYSPPAAAPAAVGYSPEEYEAHTTTFNESASGFCGTERSSSSSQEQEQEHERQIHLDNWKAHMQISLPNKP